MSEVQKIICTLQKFSNKTLTSLKSLILMVRLGSAGSLCRIGSGELFSSWVGCRLT